MVSSSCSTTIRVFPRSRRLHQSVQQLVIVPLVQADAGLVQNIGHAHQTGTNLGGQADSLGFSAGKRAGGSWKGSDNPGPHLPGSQILALISFKNLVTDQLLLLRQLQVIQKCPGALRIDRSVTSAIFFSPTVTARRFFLQALSLTGLTGSNLHK